MTKELIKVATLYTVAILLAFVAGFIAGYLFLFAFSNAVDKIETVECLELVEQSQEYADEFFYITKIEKAQCDAQGIEIDAPVK
jgi:hypothetical protein